MHVRVCRPQEKRHHITAELGYSQTWWRKYDFYFAFCEAAFDVRYIYDFHVTWVKGQQHEHTGVLAGAQPAAAAAVSTVVAAAEAGAGWVKQELPTDSFTQVRATWKRHWQEQAARSSCLPPACKALLWHMERCVRARH